jgi:uncharacterized protein YdeI (YjbR/CyaY-like superfamily)
MSDIETFHAHNAAEWRSWLEKNHEKKTRVFLTKYKKHTNKPTLSHMDAMHEAICFGWIDTTAKRVDNDVWGTVFVRRGKNARWSNNTQKYAKQLIKEGRMTEAGMAAYEKGLKKPVIDLILPENHVPKDLAVALKKNKIAREAFEKLAPSYRKTYVRWIERAKMKETRERRIHRVIEIMKKHKPIKRKGKY